ncbi:MAG: GntR family transcriptional regulator [Jatrophihabitans sp.]
MSSARTEVPTKSRRPSAPSTSSRRGSARARAAATPEPPSASRSGSVPKYYLVKRHLLEIIEALPPGSPVAPERVLTAELGTSRTTVRQALAELVGEGRLVRRQGSGTYVAEPKMAWPLSMSSFSEQAAAGGMQPGTKLLSVETVNADDVTAQRLELLPGARVHRIERLRTGDDRPMAVEVCFVEAARFVGLAAKIRRSSSLYEVFAHDYGLVPVDAEETIETAAAPPTEASLLETDTGAPMLVLSRHTFDADGRPVEWVRSWYRGDRYVFIARLQRTKGSTQDADNAG